MKDRGRWGNRTVEITAVRLLDNENREKFVFVTGESLTIALSWRTNELVKKPVFGVGVFLANGTCVYGTNTTIENIEIDQIEGEGEIHCRIDRLDLIESSYFLDVACHKIDGFPYDYHFRLYSFAVRSRFHNELGIYRPPHQWSLYINGIQTRLLEK